MAASQFKVNFHSHFIASQSKLDIQANRLAFLKEITISETISDDEDGGESDGPPGTPGLLPLPQVPPVTHETVLEFGTWVTSSEAHLLAAKSKLEQVSSTPSTLDWNTTLYNLLVAYIINFRKETEAKEARKALKANDLAKAVKLEEESYVWIHESAEFLGLGFEPLVDLAQVAFDPNDDKPEAGPFAGVFYKEGEKPFLLLSFKGTTMAWEGNTDANVKAINPTAFNLPGFRILYGKLVHGGMYQGLFKEFPEQNKKAFDVILEGLEVVGKRLGGTASKPVPLYVNGHSLGAGFAALAFIELIRRVTSDKSFVLVDLYTYGGPRLGLNGLPVKANEVLGSRRIYRFAREKDIVPNVPTWLGLQHFKHLDDGYRLTDAAPYWLKVESEIGRNTGFDLTAGWFNHFPPIYYEAIKKVIATISN